MTLTRIKTAAVLIALLAVALYVGGPLLVALALFVFVGINFEFYSFTTGLPKQSVLQFTLLSFLLPLGYLHNGAQGFAIAFSISAVLALIICVNIVEQAKHEPSMERFVPAISLGLCYTGAIGTGLVVASHQSSTAALIWVLACVIFSDTFAYFGGRAFGGKKLAPRVSPNKTLSGLGCGLAGAIAASFLSAQLLELPSEQPLILAFAGLLVGIAGVFGDLAESMIKRAYSVKDSGSLLPGHGGLLDRVDALLFALPVALMLGG